MVICLLEIQIALINLTHPSIPSYFDRLSTPEEGRHNSVCCDTIPALGDFDKLNRLSSRGILSAQPIYTLMQLESDASCKPIGAHSNATMAFIFSRMDAGHS